VDQAVTGANTVILAVPDDAIAIVAAELARAGAIAGDQVVLHLSGLYGRAALEALAPTGAALGSLHPLQSVSDPETAAERWRGAYAAIEGGPRAIAEAERLARLLGLEPIKLSTKQKAVYHAGAVLVGNYSVALAGAAARLAASVGVSPELAARMYIPLLRGAVENLGAQSPASALTGPVRRGDLSTNQAHLEALDPGDRRLYAILGLEALRLAREAGLDPGKAESIARVLGSVLSAD
jgi:predicted short-subunit dehydrogenase-like oxidoreductase (DUF2520 family)